MQTNEERVLHVLQQHVTLGHDVFLLKRTKVKVLEQKNEAVNTDNILILFTRKKKKNLIKGKV